MANQQEENNNNNNQEIQEKSTEIKEDSEDINQKAKDNEAKETKNTNTKKSNKGKRSSHNNSSKSSSNKGLEERHVQNVPYTHAIQEDGTDASSGQVKIDPNAIISEANVSTSSKNTQTQGEGTVKVNKNEDPNVPFNASVALANPQAAGQKAHQDEQVQVTIHNDDGTETIVSISKKEAEKIFKSNEKSAIIKPASDDGLSEGSVNKSAPFALGSQTDPRELKKMKRKGAYGEGEVNPSSPPGL